MSFCVVLGAFLSFTFSIVIWITLYELALDEMISDIILLSKLISETFLDSNSFEPVTLIKLFKGNYFLAFACLADQR